MKVEKGMIVKLHYEGKFEDGEIFDTSKHKDHEHPLEFEVGAGKVVPGFDKAVEGMEEGEKKEFTLTPEEGYGGRKEELQQKIPRDVLPKEQEPKAGMMLVAQAPNGQKMPVKILEVTDKEIKVDMNHPLAGKTLTFKIEIIEVKKKEEKLEDIANYKKEEKKE
jgi:FKBP-type peptidyl-prolyl cis-trans isomerase 2